MQSTTSKLKSLYKEKKLQTTGAPEFHAYVVVESSKTGAWITTLGRFIPALIGKIST